MPLDYDCEATVRRLWPFLDGALPDTERAAVQRHLEGCVHCTSHADYAREFLVAVKRAGTTAGTYDRLTTRVLGALAQEGFHGHAP